MDEADRESNFPAAMYRQGTAADLALPPAEQSYWPWGGRRCESLETDIASAQPGGGHGAGVLLLDLFGGKASGCAATFQHFSSG